MKWLLLLDALKRAYRQTGEIASATVTVDSRYSAYSASRSGPGIPRFIARDGTPVILSRPLVGALHSPDEWIDIESMGLYFRICEEFIRRKLAAS